MIGLGVKNLKRGFVVATVASLLLTSQSGAKESSMSEVKRPLLSDSAIINLRSKEEAAFHYGVSAYLWGYSLVDTEKLQRDRVRRSSPGVPQTAINQYGHVRDLRDAKYKTVPTPNNDTLYSHAFLDLADEPIIIKVPQIKDRYFVLPLLSAYQEVFAHIGTRETGTKAAEYIVVGPEWKGAIPDGLTKIESPTNMVIVWGRTVVYDKADLKKARAVQDSYALIPLSQYGKIDQTPPPDWNASKKRVTATEWSPKGGVPKSLKFFEELGKAMQLNPPKASESAMVDQFANIGLSVAKGFDYATLDTQTILGLSRAIAAAELMIDGAANYRGKLKNGWFYNNKAGIFGTDYLFRAAVAKWYAGANVAEEAMYYVSRTNAQGVPYSGKHSYRLHLKKSPPAKAFVSLSIYNASDGSFVDNELDRYSIGDRTKGIKKNADGSVDIYIQTQKPSKEKLSNWLPAPEGNFYLVLRLYIPEQSAVSGAWVPPELETVK
jgi:hypothetical protein